MEASEFKQLMKESIREALREKRLALCQIVIPAVGDREMQEIQSKLGVPGDYDEAEFTDLTDWVKNISLETALLSLETAPLQSQARLLPFKAT